MVPDTDNKRIIVVAGGSYCEEARILAEAGYAVEIAPSIEVAASLMASSEPARVAFVEQRGPAERSWELPEQKQAEEQLSISEERYRTFFSGMIEGFALHELVYDEAGNPVDYRFLEVNNAFEQQTGLKKENVVGHTKSEVLPNDDPYWLEIYAKVALTGEPARFEKYTSGLDRWYEIFAFSPVKGQFGVLFTEITQRKRGEEELHRVNRTLKAMSNGNHALMHARDEADYLDQVCRVIVEDCGHAMVWMGIAQQDEAKTVQPVAHAGFDEGYLAGLNISWADTEQGRGPTGTAIRTGRPAGCKNMLTDPEFGPWRAEALRRGYASSMAIPLMADAKAFGAITIYSREPDPFSEHEITLLSELADDIACGIAAIRLRTARVRAEEALRHSEERYRSLVELSPEALLIDRDDRIVFANSAAFQLLGATVAHEILGKSVFEIFHTDCHAGIRDRISQLLDGRPVPLNEEKIIRIDGTVRDVEVAAAPFSDSEGLAVQIMLRDVTERKLVEREREYMLEREHRIAQTLQQALVPHNIPKEIQNFGIGVRYRPALNEAEIGGDFYDVFELDNGQIGLLIGDVAGKGLRAAIRVAAARYSVRSYALIDPCPLRVMSHVNAVLCKDAEDESIMLTAFFAVIDTSSATVTYASAGHEPPVVCHASGITEELELGGMPFGVKASATYTENALSLALGDTLVMVTDGITEARAPDPSQHGRMLLLFDNTGVVDYLLRNTSASADETAAGILEAATAHAGGRLQDDAAIVVVKLGGAEN